MNLSFQINGQGENHPPTHETGEGNHQACKIHKGHYSELAGIPEGLAAFTDKIEH